MQDEEQRKQFLQKTFNTVAQDYGLRAGRFFHLSGEVMAELLGLGGNESVLDVASGTGATALPLARRLPQGQVTAVDFSSGMLKQAHLNELIPLCDDKGLWLEIDVNFTCGVKAI